MRAGDRSETAGRAIVDPEHVCALEPGPLTVQLASAGYDRGMLTSMFAERLQALVRVRDGKLEGLEEALTARNRAPYFHPEICAVFSTKLVSPFSPARGFSSTRSARCRR